MGDINQLLQQFLGSSHGNDALQTLQQEHGLTAEDAQHTLAAATEVAQQQGALDAPGGPQTALGGGVLGRMFNGALGGAAASAAGRILAQRTGMNPQMAQSVVAAAMPFVLRYLQQRGGRGASAQPQVQPRPQPQAQPSDAWFYFPHGAPPPPTQQGSSWDSPARPAEPAQPAAPTAKPKPPWKRLL
jgi:hypothetical protein